ncbi:MAG: DPP IV N-terminal domain-containing protein, partial [Gemmataceae bacterium]
MSPITVFFPNRAPVLLCAATALVAMILVRDLPGQSPEAQPWQVQAMERLKAIYDRGEFRARNNRPTWLTDSSGFVTQEQEGTAKEPTRWLHDTQSGERRAWKPDGKLPTPRDRHLSPQGTHRLITREGKLLSVHLQSGKETLLASGPQDRKVEYRNPVWSPDGSRVAFVEADFTAVRQRTVLVPEDPSYPGVQQHRFARVGGDIEKLRFGVVNPDGTGLTWLPVECPREGCYLGQFEWAGKSAEVLLEHFSRFRDKREFLLASISGPIKTIFS